jgi:hypothetical protein
MESNFDVSWIEESERMCSIETNLLREKLSSIPMMFIYINQHLVIDSVEKEILLLPDILGSTDLSFSHIIPKEKLIKLVKSKQKNTSSSKYILKEILLYHVPLEPEQISSFITDSQEKETSPFLRVFPIIEDIILPPSLFIFHSINGLYFFYYELLENTVSKKNIQIKSILKSESSHTNMMTKKVKINIPHETHRNHKRFTRKNTILL